MLLLSKVVGTGQSNHGCSLILFFLLYHSSVERLDLETERWVPVEPMLSRRSTLGVAVLKGELYAVGGFDGNNGLDTVEKYNFGKTSQIGAIMYECFTITEVFLIENRNSISSENQLVQFVIHCSWFVCG